MPENLMMDKAGKKLQQLHAVIEWLLQHWTHFPDNLYELVDGNYLPFDVKEFLAEMARQDFANAITPAIGENWRLIAKAEGVVLPDDE